MPSTTRGAAGLAVREAWRKRRDALRGSTRRAASTRGGAAAAAAAAVLVLAACGGPTGSSGDQPDPPGAVASPSVGAADGSSPGGSAGGIPTGTASGTAAACDPAGLPPELACADFTSTSGTDHGEPVDWLASDPLRVELMAMNDTATLVVDTPCNTLNVPVEVTDSTMVPHADQIAMTAMLCQGSAGEQEAWALDLFSRPLTYRVEGRTLTVDSDGARIVFERQG